MTVAKMPLDFVTGETLTPSKLNSGFEQMTKDLIESASKRFTHSCFKLDFTGLANTSTAEEFIFRIKPPFAWEVEAVELVLYEPTGTVTNVRLASSLTNWQNVDVVPLGATTRARTPKNFTAYGSANVEQTFTLSVTAGGAYTLDACYAIVHIKADRLTVASQKMADAPRFAAGESVAAGKVNTGFTDYESAVSANTAAIEDFRIQVFSLRAIAVALATSDRDLRIPASKFHFRSYDVVNLGAVGDNLTFTLLNAGGGTVSTVTVNGSGTPPAKTQGTAISHTQSTREPTVVGSDYKFRFTRAGAAVIPLGYVVMYYH
jgi:hypothetical protein